jgi:hypothetical protein
MSSRADKVRRGFTVLGAVLWILVLIEWWKLRPPREVSDIVSVAFEVATNLGEWIGTGAGVVAGIVIGLCLLGTALSGALALVIGLCLLTLRAARAVWPRGGNA